MEDVNERKETNSCEQLDENEKKREKINQDDVDYPEKQSIKNEREEKLRRMKNQDGPMKLRMKREMKMLIYEF